MNEEILCSPVRMAAIHSGKYEFAEVLLDKPLHLMGPNNIGKTSLIAMLQFLYLDNQASMHFAYSLAETRRYYFPGTNSYILFECRTPEGFQVVAAHGLGPARQYEFERFAYRGRLEWSDFMDESRMVREPDEIKALLAAKHFVKLEPRHLRAALSGVGDDRGIRLGLVPLRDRSQYERFRFLFCNLLRLAQLRQNELKDLLIEIYQNEFQQVQIDIATQFREQFSRMQRDAQQVKELRWIERDVRKLLEIVEVRDGLRGVLPLLWRELGRLFTARDAALQEQETEKRILREKLLRDEEEHKKERRRLSEQRDEMLKTQGALRGKLDAFHEEQARFADFIEDWARQRLRELDQAIAQLQARLGGLDDEPPERIQKRVEAIRSQLAKSQRLRDTAERMLLASMRSEWPDEQIASVFRVLNPELLEMHQEAVDVIQADHLRDRLTRLAENIRDGVYRDEDVALDLRGIKMPDLFAMTDPASLQMEISEQEMSLRREQARLEAAQNRAGLARQLASSQEEARTLSARLSAWELFQEKQHAAAGWERQLAQCESDAAQLHNRIEQASEQIMLLEKERQQLSHALRALDASRRELLARQQALRAPDASWTPAGHADIPEDLDDLYERYRLDYAQARKLEEEAALLLSAVLDRSCGVYDAGSETETLRHLREAVEALAGRETALQKAWTDLAVGLRSSFAALCHDLTRLEGKVGDLNRRMSRVEVSNLKAVRLIVREHPEWTRRMSKITEMQDDLPLFGAVAAVSPEIEALGALLEQVPRVHVTDLFDLHFEITGTDDKTRTYSNLDKIESNGTTITIKVLVHLILLRDLMSGGRARIPFYLDEVSSLDHDNIAGIIHQARALDFTPVLASPDSVEEVDRIYVLFENDAGKIVLDEHALLELEKRDDGA